MAEECKNLIVIGGIWNYVFRDCDDEDGCIVIEQRFPEPERRDDEPVNSVHLPRSVWTSLQLYLMQKD